ncbi:MAG: phosphatidate cytidylyltransferase [Bacteroidales bacterium]
MKNFLTRSLTGVFIVLIVAGGTLLHPVTFFLVQLVILTGSMYEYYRLIENESVRPFKIAGILTAVAIYILSAAVASGSVSAGWYLLLAPVIPALMIAQLFRGNDRPVESIAHTILALGYIAIPWAMVPFASFGNESIGAIIPGDISGFTPGPLMALFILLWSNDTGAYLVGISFGKHRLFERISPKKSWEGFFGGVLLTVVAAWLISPFFGITSTAGWIVIALLVSVAGTFGDLVESMIKRSAGVKDSGSIMPGHGGFLDRFDSVLFAWPMVFLFITFFG